MEKVTGIGGVFFKSPDPKTLQQWYVDNLGIEPDEGGYVSFVWREKADPERRLSILSRSDIVLAFDAWPDHPDAASWHGEEFAHRVGVSFAW